MNRVLISKLSTLHFSPTEVSRLNLINEGIEENLISLTGNTVIDNCENIKNNFPISKLSGDITNFVNTLDLLNKKYILVTCHRRENQDQALENLCEGLKITANDFTNINIVFVMHANKA